MKGSMKKIIILSALYCTLSSAMDVTYMITSQTSQTPPPANKSETVGPDELLKNSLRGVTYYRPGSTRYSQEECKNVLNSLDNEQLRSKMLLLMDQNFKGKPGRLLLYGPPGSGKTTLAGVLAQTLGRGYLVVKAPGVPNEYVNSGVQGLLRIYEIAKKLRATVIFEEVNALAKERENSNKNTATDNTPGAFWLILDDLFEQNILVIGTTNNIQNMPEQLQSRFKMYLYELCNPVTHEARSAIMIDHLKRLSAKYNLSVFKRLENHLIGLSSRDLEYLVAKAYELAYLRNNTETFITYAEFIEALNFLKINEKLLGKTHWHGDKILTRTTQGTSVIANIGSMVASAITISSQLRQSKL